jgi:hypothetical protein
VSPADIVVPGRGVAVTGGRRRAHGLLGARSGAGAGMGACMAPVGSVIGEMIANPNPSALRQLIVV